MKHYLLVFVLVAAVYCQDKKKDEEALVKPEDDDFYCYDCVEGRDEGCEPLNVESEKAESQFKKYCNKDEDIPDNIKEKYGKGKVPKAEGCRKMEQEIGKKTSIVRQCAYNGANVDDQKRVGNEGVRMFYWQCDTPGCNGAQSIVSTLFMTLAIPLMLAIILKL